jgi:hypothetical protein
MKDVANVIPSPDLYVAMLTCASSSGGLWDLVAAGDRTIPRLLYHSVVSVHVRAYAYAAVTECVLSMKHCVRVVQSSMLQLA